MVGLGYIAPVNNFQYQQYAERVASKRYNPYHFVPISTIKPLENPREFTHQEQQFHLGSSSQETNRKINPKKQSIEKIYSEITGIGRFYNEYI